MGEVQNQRHGTGRGPCFFPLALIHGSGFDWDGWFFCVTISFGMDALRLLEAGHDSGSP